MRSAEKLVESIPSVTRSEILVRLGSVYTPSHRGTCVPRGAVCTWQVPQAIDLLAQATDHELRERLGAVQSILGSWSAPMWRQSESKPCGSYARQARSVGPLEAARGNPRLKSHPLDRPTGATRRWPSVSRSGARRIRSSSFCHPARLLQSGGSRRLLRCSPWRAMQLARRRRRRSGGTARFTSERGGTEVFIRKAARKPAHCRRACGLLPADHSRPGSTLRGARRRDASSARGPSHSLARRQVRVRPRPFATARARVRRASLRLFVDAAAVGVPGSYLPIPAIVAPPRYSNSPTGDQARGMSTPRLHRIERPMVEDSDRHLRALSAP